MSDEQGLGEVLAAFQANRATTMAPEALAENIRQRRVLTETANRAAFVRAGQKVPDFALHSVEGPVLTRDALLAQGPVALVFFRFAGCPVCNVTLPYYDRHLRPALDARGIRLIAVSPQVPDKLGEIRTKHGLGLTVATDTDNALARSFGITFAPDEPAQAAAKARGFDLSAVTGASNSDLPFPAVVLIDRDGTVLFADITPDWLARTEVEAILSAVKSKFDAPQPA